MKNLILKIIENFIKFFIGILLIVLVIVIGFNDKLLSESLSSVKTYPPNKNSVPYLEMHGSVKESKNWEIKPLKNIEDAEITIFNLDNKVVGYTCSDEGGTCFIKLPLDNQFIIKVSKKGYVTKIINVDTRLSIKEFKHYELDYEIEMFEDIYGIDVSILKKPIANIRYNNFLSSFDYDFIYTDQVNGNLKTAYSCYYNLHPENNNSQNYKKTKKHDNSKRIRFTPRNLSKLNKDTVKNNSVSVHNNIGNKIEDYGMNDNRIIENIDSSDIVFKIQISSINEYLTQDAKLFEKFGRVNEYIYNGKHNYTIGEFKTFAIASKMLNEINVNGYKDAILVAFYKGQRISIDKAQLVKYAPK